MPHPELLARARQTERWCRFCLGFVWIYEGLVPKILYVNVLPVQSALIASAGLWVYSPRATLIALGLAQLSLGLVLLTGWRARAMAALATVWMLALIVLVGWHKPDMWVDPFGAFAKDACLLACAAAIWMLREPPATR